MPKSKYGFIIPHLKKRILFPRVKNCNALMFVYFVNSYALTGVRLHNNRQIFTLPSSPFPHSATRGGTMGFRRPWHGSLWNRLPGDVVSAICLGLFNKTCLINCGRASYHLGQWANACRHRPLLFWFMACYSLLDYGPNACIHTYKYVILQTKWQ